MTDEPMTSPILPGYGEGSLPDLACSLLASLGVPDEPNSLELPSTSRACLLIVDGLGWELLHDHPAAAPFLSELGHTGRALTAGFPATTVTSLSSLGTGLPPGLHGMLGYQVEMPGTGRLLNGLRWDSRVDPLAWQPSPTIYQRAAAAGVAAYRVAAERARRRPAFPWRRCAVPTTVRRTAPARSSRRPRRARGRRAQPGHRVPLRARRHRALVRQPLRRVALPAGLRGQAGRAAGRGLPPGATLHVTADHGMVDVAVADQVDVDEVTALRDGVAAARRRAAGPARVRGRRRCG